MRKIDLFYQNLRHNDPIEEQIQQSGIIKSYFLTTLNAMNARRNTDLCLWCDATWSVDHRCERAPVYNCRFSFGGDDDGMAFVQVSKEGLKHIKVEDSHVKALNTNADNMLDEMCVSDSCTKSAREMFEEMPVPDFMLEMARAANMAQENEEMTDAHHVFDKMSEQISSSPLAQLVGVNDDGILTSIDTSSQLCSQNKAEEKLATEIDNPSVYHGNLTDNEAAHIGELIDFQTEVICVEQNFDSIDEPSDMCEPTDLDCGLGLDDYPPIFDNDELQSCVDKVGAQQYGPNDSDLLFACHQFGTGKLANRDGLFLNTLSLVFEQMESHTTYSCSGPLFSYLTLEDKGDLRGEEGGIYVRDTSVLIMDEVSCHNCLLSQIDKSIGILTYTFDPGGLTWEGCKTMITWSDFFYGRNKLSAFLDTSYDRGGGCHEMEAQMKVFDPGLIFMDKSRLLQYTGFKGKHSMANVFCEGELFPTYNFDHGYGCSLMGVILSCLHNYSNSFEFVLKLNSPAGQFLEMIRKYQGLEIVGEYIKDAPENSHLGFTSIIGPVEKMALAIHPIKGLYYMDNDPYCGVYIYNDSIFIFDPGGSNNSLLLKMTFLVVVVWVFDPGGFESESEMIKQVGISRSSVQIRLKWKRCEEYKTYVFDPGIISLIW